MVVVLFAVISKYNKKPFLSEESQQYSSRHGGSDDTRDIRSHGVHEQVVARIEFPADNLGDSGAVRDGGHTGVPDQRVDLPVTFEEKVPELDEEHTGSRRDNEREQSEDEYLQRVTSQELVRLG